MEGGKRLVKSNWKFHLGAVEISIAEKCNYFKRRCGVLEILGNKLQKERANRKTKLADTRKLLENCFLALLDSGIDYRTRNVGCYTSGSSHDYMNVSEPVSRGI